MSKLLFTSSPYRQMHAFQGLERKSHTSFMSRKFVFGPFTVIVGLIFAAIFMSFLHLLHFNQVATKGYDLRRLEMDRQQLSVLLQTKNMHVTNIKSLDVISKSSKVKSMVRQNDVGFVRGDTALAFHGNP